MTKPVHHALRHGLCLNGIKHPIYKVRERMKRYCYTLSESDRNYPYYRGKGIKMCDAWLNDARTFYDWCMANGWQQGMEIDRIDSNGDYSPENCQLLPKAEHCKKTWKERNALNPVSAMAKLTVAHVEVIKRLVALGYSCTKIAEFFEVGRTTIKYIAANKTWKYVKIEE